MEASVYLKGSLICVLVRLIYNFSLINFFFIKVPWNVLNDFGVIIFNHYTVIIFCFVIKTFMERQLLCSVFNNVLSDKPQEYPIIRTWNLYYPQIVKL
jgi:hypothetical protein